jgi:ketosteroid isomerase-like protein
LILLLAAIAFLLPATAQQKDEMLIRTMLSEQTAAWNRGNIEGFMKGYWESDSLVFMGKSGMTKGYAATLARYKKGYPDTAHMGQLTSNIISMQRLSANYYFVTGKWHLDRSVGMAEGYYSLLIRLINGYWVIVNDHSS